MHLIIGASNFFIGSFFLKFFFPSPIVDVFSVIITDLIYLAHRDGDGVLAWTLNPRVG